MLFSVCDRPVSPRHFVVFLLRCLLVAVTLLSPMGTVASVVECWRLRDTCRMATQNSDHREAVRAAARLQRVAEREGDDWFLGQALYYQGVSNVILGNNKIGKAQLDRAYQLADRLDDDTLRLSIHNGYGVYEANAHADYASAQRHFYKALEYAVGIGDPFRQALVESNLAETASIRRDVSGLKYALECYEWSVANDNAHLGFAGAYHCANLYSIAGDYQRALHYIRKAEEIARRENYAERAAVYSLHGSICAALGQNREALEWLHKAVGHASEAQGATLPEMYRTYAGVLADLGDVAGSDRMVSRGLEVSDSLSIRSSVAPLLEQRARNHESRGDYRRALEVYRIYKEVCDSAYADRQQQSVNELRVQYDIARREQEADMQRLLLRDERRKTAILLISLLSVAVILLILWRHYWRQKRLYRNIVIANRDAVAREQELMARLEAATQPVAADSVDAPASASAEMERGEAAEAIPPAAAPVSPAARNDSVFDRLCHLMEREQVFRDNGLSRERLAEMLGTNRTYLSQIIADRTGKGYYQFVNGYRIKEAVRILSGPAGADYPLKALAADLGFKSMTTFYKTFQEAVGMTPSAYRDTARRL